MKLSRRLNFGILAIIFLLVSLPTVSFAGFIRGIINAGGTARYSIGNIGRGFKTLGHAAMAISGIKPALPALEEFKLGEAYAFPNPAKGGKKPTIHVEVGIADAVELKFFDVAGDLVQETGMTALPQLINDGQGNQYAYEYTWDGNIPSGIYICVVRVRRQGKDDIKTTIKIAVIR